MSTSRRTNQPAHGGDGYPILAVAHALGGLKEHGGDAALVERQVDAVLDQVAALDLQRAGRGRRPPT